MKSQDVPIDSRGILEESCDRISEEIHGKCLEKSSESYLIGILGEISRKNP